MHSHHRAMLDSRPQTENGEYLKSIANGTNGNRLEAYPTLRRRLVTLGPWVMVIPHDLGPSLAAPKSNVA
jgi:hypothetical protein